MPRLLKLAIPLTGRTTVVPLNAAPVALDARAIEMLPVNALSVLPRESRTTTSTGGVMTCRTFAELGCTKNPSTGGEFVPPLLPPEIPIIPEREPVKQPLAASVSSVRTTLERVIRIARLPHTTRRRSDQSRTCLQRRAFLW